MSTNHPSFVPIESEPGLRHCSNYPFESWAKVLTHRNVDKGKGGVTGNCRDFEMKWV